MNRKTRRRLRRRNKLLYKESNKKNLSNHEISYRFYNACRFGNIDVIIELSKKISLLENENIQRLMDSKFIQSNLRSLLYKTIRSSNLNKVKFIIQLLDEKKY